MDASNGQQSYQASGQGHIDMEQNSFGHSASIVRPNHKTRDPDMIVQWQANSATDPDLATGHGFPGYDSASYRNEMPVTCVAHETPGSFPFPHFDMMQTPSQFLSMYQSYGVEESYHDMGATSAGSRFPGTDIAFEMPQGHAFDMTQLIQGEQRYTNSSSVNNLAYQAMTTGAFFPGLAELHPPMVLGNNDGGYALPAEWDHQVMYQDNAVGVSQHLEYSPASGLAPSTSSSYSFLGQLPDTPVSMDLHEDWPIGEPGPMNGDHENFPHISAGAAMQIPTSFDLPTDSGSTIRPSNSFQRTPFSMDAWVGPEMMDPAFGISSYAGMDGSRRSSDGEAGRNARENPLYKAVPQEDGLYHCPFAVKDGCSKSPEKLKCNYDKHLDSHLKPYRCKSNECSDTHFSSTACLLRHEREAHGMHGHGAKPFLCIFEGCERAHENHGFPRRWNLLDHMKRVHGYSASEPSNNSDSPSPSDSSSHKDPVNGQRKRRTPSPTENRIAKRAKVATSRADEQPSTTLASGSVAMAIREQPVPPKFQQYPSEELLLREHQARMESRLKNLDLSDPQALEQYHGDNAMFENLARKLHSRK